jgi:hypothetical protein
MHNFYFSFWQNISVFKRLINILATRPIGQGVGTFRAKTDKKMIRTLNYEFKIVCLIVQRV